MIKNFLLLILTLVISSSVAQENFKEYYYPMDTKKEVNVYKYIDKNNAAYVEYWKVTVNPEKNHILTESFTTDFRLYNVFEEAINRDGAEIIDYVDFEQNDEGQNVRIQGTVVDKNVYKWNATGTYKYSVKFRSPTYGNQHFIKERTKNSFMNINVLGTDYATLRFMDEYEIKLLDNNQSYTFYQFTYYAKGIGMVKYQRYYPDGTVRELELAAILKETIFDKLVEKANR